MGHWVLASLLCVSIVAPGLAQAPPAAPLPPVIASEMVLPHAGIQASSAPDDLRIYFKGQAEKVNRNQQPQAPIRYPKFPKKNEPVAANEEAQYHIGRDFPTPEPTPFKAGVYGQVLAVNPSGSVLVGLPSGNVIHYVHASRLDAKVGQEVTPDTVLGLTSNHIHLQATDQKNRLIDVDAAFVGGRERPSPNSTRIQWEASQWVDVTPEYVGNRKPIVIDGVLQYEESKRGYYAPGLASGSKPLDEAKAREQAIAAELKNLTAERDAAAANKTGADAKQAALAAEEQALANKLSQTDRRGLELNREGMQLEQLQKQLPAQKAKLEAREAALNQEAKAVEAAARAVRTQREVEAINGRILNLNAALEAHYQEKLKYNAMVEDVKQKDAAWQGQVDALQAQQKSTEAMLTKVRAELRDLAKTSADTAGRLSAKEGELRRAQEDARKALEERKKLEAEFSGK